jgi:hypothetical protein
MPRPGGVIFTNVGAAAQVITSGAGKKDVAIHLAPSGADTVKVEATLASPDDLAATWFEVIAATNTATVVTLTGPYAALRMTRVTGATDLNKLTVYSPSN